MNEMQWIVMQVTTYIACVYDRFDIIEIRMLPSRRQHWCLAQDLHQWLDVLFNANHNGDGIHIGVNPRKWHRGAKSDEVALARCLFADFDGITVEDAQARWRTVGLPEPTMVVNSGHGCHLYLATAQPIHDFIVWRGLQADLSTLLGSDGKIKDPPRVMRMPGFWNLKSEPFVPCMIVEADPARRYDFAAIRAIIPQQFAVVTQQRRAPIPAVQWQKSNFRIIELTTRAHRYLAKVPGAVAGQNGHNRTFSVACALVLGFDLSVEEAMPLIAAWNQTCLPPWNEYELWHKLIDADSQLGDRGYLIHQQPKAVEVTAGAIRIVSHPPIGRRRRRSNTPLRTITLEP